MSRMNSLLVVSLLACSTASMGAPQGVPILNDDLARARAEASRRHVPVFVEVWAPW